MFSQTPNTVSILQKEKLGPKDFIFGKDCHFARMPLAAAAIWSTGGHVRALSSRT